ncbi:MAG: 30S ribosome-binding factor RbfA [Deltaproteobacteria bacterium]|nr:30S ribosome-binding factor RbfA [Deltaproteobacteria bacterium]
MAHGRGRRPERVADVIKEEIAIMVMHGEIKDPRIGFVTITHVKLSPDMKDAKVYFSQIGSSGDKDESRQGLQSASGYIRRSLAKRLSLRHIPAISFHFDDSLEYAERIENVIRDIKKGGGL